MALPKGDNLGEGLVKFLSGDPIALDEFPRSAERYLQHLAHVFGAGLPSDILCEIVNQTLLNLCQRDASCFDPSRASAGTFLRLLARDSARQVRAMYTSA